MAIEEIVVTAPQTPSWSVINPIDIRGGGGGVYDSLFGGIVPDFSTMDLNLDPTGVTPEVDQAVLDAWLAENGFTFNYDPKKDKSAEVQFVEQLADFQATLAEKLRTEVITQEEMAQLLTAAHSSVGVDVFLDPSKMTTRASDYGVRTDDRQTLAIPTPTFTQTSAAQQAAAQAAASAAAQGVISDAVGSIMNQQTGGGVSASGGGGGGVVVGDVGGGDTFVSLEPDADLFGGNTGLEGVGIDDAVGTGVGYLGGAAGTNADGSPILEGAGTPTVLTPQQQWQNVLNDPNVDVAGAVAAAELIFGNSPAGVAAVADAANKANVSAEEVATASGYNIADIIAAAASVGVPFLIDKKTTATNNTATNNTATNNTATNNTATTNTTGTGTGTGTVTGTGTEPRL